MANAVYPKYKEALIQGTAGTPLTGTLNVVLLDTAAYTYSAAHEFYSSMSAGAVGTPVAITGKTFTNGLLDGADVTFTAVSGASCEAIAIFLDTGTPSTSRLVAYIDTGVGNLPVTPNGSDITVNWNAAGIVQF